MTNVCICSVKKVPIWITKTFFNTNINNFKPCPICLFSRRRSRTPSVTLKRSRISRYPRLSANSWKFLTAAGCFSPAAFSCTVLHIQTMNNLQHRQKENRQNRMLLVSSGLLQHNRGIAQTVTSRLMLEGEFIPIEPLPALPACTQCALFGTVISGGAALYRADAMCQVYEDAYEKICPR